MLATSQNFKIWMANWSSRFNPQSITLIDIVTLL